MKPSEIQFAKNLEALKSPQCRRIIRALYTEARTVADLAAVCKLSQGSIEKHLEVLADAGLVETKVMAGAVTYVLQTEVFSETHDWFKALGQ